MLIAALYPRLCTRLKTNTPGAVRTRAQSLLFTSIVRVGGVQSTRRVSYRDFDERRNRGLDTYFNYTAWA